MDGRKWRLNFSKYSKYMDDVRIPNFEAPHSNVMDCWEHLGRDAI
jgi:hypothetical protein